MPAERYDGDVARRFTVANKVDEAKTKAEYADGVRELALPQTEGVTIRSTLTIQQIPATLSKKHP